MSKKKSNKRNSQEPILSMPIYRTALFLDLYPASWAPVIWSLTLPWDKTGISVVADPMVHVFKSFESRNNYMAALSYVMKYQQMNKHLAQIMAQFDAEVKEFRQYVQNLDSMNMR